MIRQEMTEFHCVGQMGILFTRTSNLIRNRNFQILNNDPTANSHGRKTNPAPLKTLPWRGQSKGAIRFWVSVSRPFSIIKNFHFSMIAKVILPLLSLAFATYLGAATDPATLPLLEDCNVIWDSPSHEGAD